MCGMWMAYGLFVCLSPAATLVRLVHHCIAVCNYTDCRCVLSCPISLPIQMSHVHSLATIASLYRSLSLLWH